MKFHRTHPIHFNPRLDRTKQTIRTFCQLNADRDILQGFTKIGFSRRDPLFSVRKDTYVQLELQYFF